MDKSGRRALARNLSAITAASESRRSWTLAKKLDTKTVERAEKDEGEKGVSLQAVDDIARSLGLAAWQLLVPGLDLKNPPRLATDPPPASPAPSLPAALAIVGEALGAEMPDYVRQDAADLLSKLAQRRGLTRHQSEIVGLLQTYAATGILTPESREGFALDHAMSPVAGHDGPVPNEWDSKTPPSGGHEQWAPNIGTRVNAAGPRTDKQRDHYPGKTTPKAGKKTA